jgi:outer membrane biosynthesis protein TonB
MTKHYDCAYAETVAGAVALGEADEVQRDSYRKHLATCAGCRNDLGGEREIERVMATAREARESERWEPSLRIARMQPRERQNSWQWAAALAAAIALIVGFRAIEKPPSAPAAVSRASASSAQVTRAVAALETQTGPRRENQVESLSFASTRPSTLALTVRLDARGTPERCTVTKSSGNRVLDGAVCRAAIKAVSSRRGALP